MSASIHGADWWAGAICREPTDCPALGMRIFWLLNPNGVLLREVGEDGNWSWGWPRPWQSPLHPTGTTMTPNFVSNINASVALSCTCRGSGNLQEECERLEESFSHNPCLSEYAPPAPSSVARSAGSRERERANFVVYTGSICLQQTGQPPPQHRFTSPQPGAFFFFPLSEWPPSCLFN